MADLKCGVCNCSYNRDRYCCKGDIMVGKESACHSSDTCCESFMDQGEYGAYNQAETPTPSIRIDCEAGKCMYNSNYKCHAEKVEIRGNGAKGSVETLCATFREA